MEICKENHLNTGENKFIQKPFYVKFETCASQDTRVINYLLQ